ncbi:hypothetical protein BH683_009265 [Williamsia sp. 1138]|uniref:hypothetical protein n=1 Tax=Williamsia sp. 1138 TaxID=1903117 RepID=UPI000A25932C|nr:hypothetical protein [Williamsia sp. 1138]OZG29366.1 hypothetical protein BH683_009265 [Williamsia sp. 1138]
MVDGLRQRWVSGLLALVQFVVGIPLGWFLGLGLTAVSPKVLVLLLSAAVGTGAVLSATVAAFFFRWRANWLLAGMSIGISVALWFIWFVLIPFGQSMTDFD